ncbi:MAG: acylphosphatase, partial [Promethearchaeota archaeon]
MKVQVDIAGIVQGVGFRPFLYNLAAKYQLKGYILNRGNAGVRLLIQGAKDVVWKFIDDIEREKPEISRIDDLNVKVLADEDVEDFTSLKIRSSEDAKGPTIVLPADIATCNECIDELLGMGPGGKSNKYYNYPFVACAVCGPRFT